MGIWLSRDMPDGTARYDICQGGGVIEAEISKKAGKITGLAIGGEVKLGEEIEFPAAVTGNRRG
jgi:hypothetical protein